MWAIFVKGKTGRWNFVRIEEHEERATELEEDIRLSVESGEYMSYRIVNLED